MAAAVDSLRTQVDTFFDLVTEEALGEILGSDLPIVGDIANAATAALLGDIREAIADALGSIEAAASDTKIAKQIAAKLDGLFPGLTATATGDKVAIAIVDSDSVNFGASLPNIDVGSDGLGLELGGTVGVKLGLDINAALSFDVGDRALRVIDNGADTATVHLEGSLKDLDAKGELGFLEVKAKDALGAPEIDITAAIDVNGGTVTQLVSQPLAKALDIALDGSARLDLALVAGIGGPDSTAPSVIPKIFTNLTTGYEILGYDPFSGDGDFGAPKVAFEDIEIDTGSLLEFLGGVFQPVFDGVFGSFPMKQLLNTVTAELPLISDALDAIGLLGGFDYIEDGKINLLDLGGVLASAAGATKESIEAFSTAISLIQGLSALTEELNDPGGRIKLADIYLVGDSAAPLGAQSILSEDALDALADALKSQDAPEGTDGLGSPASSLADLLDGTGFKIPLLTDPAAILSILTNGFGGQPVDLIEYDVPELKFNARFDQFFNIIGPFGVGFYGDFGAEIDFAIGYDTKGVKSGKFEQGFYFTTSDGEPAGIVTAEVGAKAGVNIGIAEGGVSGGLFAGLKTYFDDEDGDGKLRLVDVGNCLFDPITGEFGIKVQAYVSIGFSPFEYTKRFDIVRVVLANFNFGCPPPETTPDHGLAALGVSAGDTLTFNAGTRAQFRQINKVKGVDGEETYVVSNAAKGALTVSAFGISEINGHPNAGPQTDDLIAPQLVEAHMGKANDQVAFDEGVAVRANLSGDEGDDLLASGSGNDRLRGGVGADRLLGRAGTDQLLGEGGNDMLEGGAGADLLNGGEDFDQVSYEFSTAGVRITALGTLGVFVGEGGDAQGDKLYSIEHLIGSHFDDQLAGTEGGRNILEGLDGADVLFGGTVEDLLLGGGAADSLYGDTGDDTVSYASSAGQVQVDLATGQGAFGDAEGDYFNSVENVQGSFGDDTLIGNAADNRLDGWFGDDTLTGNGGKDRLDGGAGADVILGGADGDTISGGGALGSVERDTLSYAASGFGVKVSLAATSFADTQDLVTRAQVGANQYSTIEDLTGSRFDDHLTGDAQANVILAGAGADIVVGGEGNDTITGGVSGDQIDGGLGRDLASYRTSSAGVTVNLVTNGNSGGDAQGDVLTSIEDLRGSSAGDTLTGSATDNRIDAGLSRSTAADRVEGGTEGANGDVLVVDWSEGDIGQGMSGGFNSEKPGVGSFDRQRATTTERLDHIDFSGIERLEVVGTSENDSIAGGARSDLIATGDGDDRIHTGRGLDRVDAGAGIDYVAVGTELFETLSSAGDNSFGDIRGGAGVDFLSLSLAAVFSDVTIRGRDGTADFVGTNYATATGSAITDFEILYFIMTGFGDDVLTQPGRWANVFLTGFGVDRISAGLGKDTVDAGLDFRMGEEIDQTPVTERTLIALADDFATAFASDGDFMEVDYRNSTFGVSGSIQQADTGYDLRTAGGHRVIDLYTNKGYYSSGEDRVDLNNVERVRVLGSGVADGFAGTDLTYGLNVYEGADRSLVASGSERGDDLLYGFGGNDVMIGGTGEDLLDGGDGDDLLLGAKYGSTRIHPDFDLGEVDRLIGGAGRDSFIVGLGYNYYNDITNEDQASGRRSSTDNRAIIADFAKAADTLILGGFDGGTPPAAYYRVVERDGSSFIYLRDGVDAAGVRDRSADELIAELDGVTGFGLNAGYVLYYTVDGQYLRGDGTPTDPPLALSTSGPDLETALAALAGDHPSPADAVPAYSGIDMATPVVAPSAEAVAQAAQPGAAADLPWVTQTADAAALQYALFGKDSAISYGTMTLSGNSAGFGTFIDDPFKLGSGVILSTGQVTDVAGVNEIDGGRQTGRTVELEFEQVGAISTGGVRSVIYRVDLSTLDFSINSIRLGDSNSGFGGGGDRASGFDIDAVWLSRDDVTGIDTAAKANAISRLDAFSFNYAQTEFEQGTLRSNANAEEYTQGVFGGLVDFGRATLNTVDGKNPLGAGSVTLGDGGSLGFDLNKPVGTDKPLWLYVAEAGTVGETITTGFTASENRLTAPADLSTDLGRPGGEDDTVSLTYTFQPRSKEPITSIAFDFVFFSEEFAEFAQAGFNDKFKVTLNGVNLARLSDGSFASVDTLYSPAAGPDSYNGIYGLVTRSGETDFVYNPVGTGPVADSTRADGFSRTLRFVGDIDPFGMNELKIEVQDSGDGLLDSGILIRGADFALDTNVDFEIDRDIRPVREGDAGTLDFGLIIPPTAQYDKRVSVIFTPDDEIDLGAGAGNAIEWLLDGDNPFGVLDYKVIGDIESGSDYFTTIGVSLHDDGGVTTLAPVVIEIDDDRMISVFGNGRFVMDHNDFRSPIAPDSLIHLA